MPKLYPWDLLEMQPGRSVLTHRIKRFFENINLGF
nr:MAG TPA: hypothetical protein [Caudoviricetes sp.]